MIRTLLPRNWNIAIAHVAAVVLISGSVSCLATIFGGHQDATAWPAGQPISVAASFFALVSGVGIFVLGNQWAARPHRTPARKHRRKESK